MEMTTLQEKNLAQSFRLILRQQRSFCKIFLINYSGEINRSSKDLPMSPRLHCTALHDAHIVHKDAPVSKNSLYLLLGDNKIPMYFDRNCGIKRQNPELIQGYKRGKITKLEFEAH